jgi:C-terminal processing protease CtpA/Prc
VLGFIGANVLRNFRLEVDFPNQMTYWTAGPRDTVNDFDIVGLTVRPDADSSFTVVGVVSEDGKPTVEGAQPGDKLVSVDGFEVTGATMGTVVDALRGRPGSRRTIVLERAGKRLTIEAAVKRLP